MQHPHGAIPRRRLCRAFMKKFQIQRNSDGKSLISALIQAWSAHRNNLQTTVSQIASAPAKPVVDAAGSTYLCLELERVSALGRPRRNIPAFGKTKPNWSARLGRMKPKFIATSVVPVSLERALERCRTCAIVSSPPFFDDGETDGLRFGPIH